MYLWWCWYWIDAISILNDLWLCRPKHGGGGDDASRRSGDSRVFVKSSIMATTPFGRP